MSDIPDTSTVPLPIREVRNYGALLCLALPVSAILWAAYHEWAGIFGLATKVFVALAVVTVIHTLGCALFARILGAQLGEIALGIGSSALSKQIREITWSLRSVPAGGFVRVAGMGYDAVENGNSFKSLPLINRVLISASGCLSTLLFAVILMGPRDTAQSFVSTYPQFFDVFLFPLSRGQAMLSYFAESARSATWPVLIACVGVKMAVYNLLPIPTLNGGAILLELFRGKITMEHIQKIMMFGFMILMLLFLSLMMGIASFIIRTART
jgi:membrane-associated protease RseP (regulator of RpoE activity)